MSRRALIGILSGLCLATAIVVLMPPGRPQRVEQPQPDVRYVAAEDWQELTLTRPATDTGWVALPPSREGELYASPVAVRIMTPDDCRDCHADIVDSFLETAHARTASLPSTDSILGSFAPPDNRVQTGVDGFYLEMIREEDQFLQAVRVPHPNDNRHPVEIRVPIAFVIGSGNHGQSFLHWEGDQLCQMPISYFSEFDRWTNSPGLYQDGSADFSRPVTNRCLDCHTTWFGHDPRSINRFDRTRFVLNVTCVRCHGPANEHVHFHRLHPESVEPHFIVNPSSLDRERGYEVCAQCHSGGGELRRPAFSYIPGEPLLEYLDVDLTAASELNEDPHSANQLGRLMRSRCFQQSTSLTCATCHDPHRHERGNVELFSRRCLSCHSVDDCGTRPRLGSAMESRCVDCHMPSQRDAEVTAAGADGDLLPLLRDHLIGIWPEASMDVEELLDATPSPSDAPPENESPLQ